MLLEQPLGASRLDALRMLPAEYSPYVNLLKRQLPTVLVETPNTLSVEGESHMW